MNDEDKKLIEEAERLDAEATVGPWVDDDDGFWNFLRQDVRFIIGARSLLPKLAKRLREALNVSDVPPEPAKLPEPLVDGYYWVRGWGGRHIVAERETDRSDGEARWIIPGDEESWHESHLEPLLGPLQLPTVTNVTK